MSNQEQNPPFKPYTTPTTMLPIFKKKWGG